VGALRMCHLAHESASDDAQRCLAPRASARHEKC
jgi:hypothetical protein